MRIGRNEKCPCGSGKKYKRCCAGKPQQAAKQKTTGAKERATLRSAIEKVQADATEKKEMVVELGVFLLYADHQGDAWLLEITDSDCIQVASAGKTLEVPLEENEETIVVDWSHTYEFKNKQLQITAYKDKEVRVLKGAPSQQLFAAEKRILRRYSPELLDQVHISK